MIGILQRRFFFGAVLTAVLIVLVSLYWQIPTLKVTPDSVMSLMGKGDIPAIIDVRTKPEYERGHLPYATHMSLGLLFFQHDELAVSRRGTVIVYCSSGFRAQVASIFLRFVGFDSIYVLEGQLRAWKRSGYPVLLGE